MNAEDHRPTVTAAAIVTPAARGARRISELGALPSSLLNVWRPPDVRRRRLRCARRLRAQLRRREQPRVGGGDAVDPEAAQRLDRAAGGHRTPPCRSRPRAPRQTTAAYCPAPTRWHLNARSADTRPHASGTHDCACLKNGWFSRWFVDVAEASPQQGKLGRPRQALDPCLLSASGGAVGHDYHERQLDRQSAGRVAAGRTGTVARQACARHPRSSPCTASRRGSAAGRPRLPTFGLSFAVVPTRPSLPVGTRGLRVTRSRRYEWFGGVPTERMSAMSLLVRFSPESLTSDRYDEVKRRLNEAGHWPPPALNTTFVSDRTDS